MKIKNNKAGISILGAIILAIFIFLALREYFHIDLQAIFINDQVISTYHEIQTAVIHFWHQYLETTVLFFWHIFIDNMQRIHDGQPTIFNQAGQNLILH